jgi:hypothetical protein
MDCSGGPKNASPEVKNERRAFLLAWVSNDDFSFDGRKLELRHQARLNPPSSDLLAWLG